MEVNSKGEPTNVTYKGHCCHDKKNTGMTITPLISPKHKENATKKSAMISNKKILNDDDDDVDHYSRD
jgi:hypothetical protein